jgi:hypothetical protein
VEGRGAVWRMITAAVDNLWLMWITPASGSLTESYLSGVAGRMGRAPGLHGPRSRRCPRIPRTWDGPRQGGLAGAVRWFSSGGSS